MSRETSRGKVTVTLLCEVFGISRQAYYAAQKRASAPEPPPKAKVVRLPRRPNHAPAEVVLRAIHEVVDEHPAWGVRKVWAMLRREHELKVSKKRVWALMNAEDLVLERDRDPGDPPRGHVVTEEPNRRFATDMTTVWTKQEGWVAVFPTVDCGCRSGLGMVVSKSQDALTAMASLREALVSAFGTPDAVPDDLELRTDHGSIYTGADCEDLVETWGLEHTYAPIGRPTGNAVVERFIRTMKEEVVWLRDWNNADELREALEQWLVVYNTRRPHQALDWQTPAERRSEKLGTTIPRAA